MNERDGRRGNLPGRVAVVAAVVAVMGAGSPAIVAVAHDAPLFNGSYTVVQPDKTSTWIVSSGCAFLGCVASVVSDSLTGFTMLFDGTKWNQLAVPHVGTCGGATVPASDAEQFLMPQKNGSFRGARTVTVQCDGTTVTQSQPLTATPVRA